MRSVVNLGLSVFLLLGLQACSFTGKGEWSDSKDSSGSLESKFILDFKERKVTYELEFDDGTKEVFKLYFKKDDDTNIYNAEGEVLATVEENEEGKKPLIFEIDDKQVEIFFAEHDSGIALPATGSITYSDGRVLTWKDELTMDELTADDLDGFEGLNL